MDRKAAKELLHIEGWLARAGGVAARGKHAYLADEGRTRAHDDEHSRCSDSRARLLVDPRRVLMPGRVWLPRRQLPPHRAV